MSTNRIHNEAKARRIVLFEGLPFVGTCSPTDVDFAMEVKLIRRYLTGDFKEWGKTLENLDGQRWLLERTVNAFARMGYKASAFIAWHEEDEDPVYAASTTVAYVYRRNEWVPASSRMTFLEFYERFFFTNNGHEPQAKATVKNYTKEEWDEKLRK